MFERISPEKAGISSEAVLGFIKMLEKYKMSTHSIIMARGNNIFCETYYAPFNKDFKHRMYSISKSFVAIAVGLLVEDGKMSLDDKFIDYLPEYKNENDNEWLYEMTIRDALTMSTCKRSGVNWFSSGTEDRTEVYFRNPADKIPGTFFQYDSPVSYQLCAIVERICGKPFLEFLKDRFLRDCGFSEDAYCIKCPGGHSFGDSGIMCTSRDLLTMARFVANKGTWEGKRYMDERFLTEATSKQVANDIGDHYTYGSFGYGYQIWKAPRDGFAFVGMGDQFAIYDPITDFLFVINSDNQGNSPMTRFVLYYELYENIIEKLSDTPLPENKAAYDELCAYESNRKLVFADGKLTSDFAKNIDGVTYVMNGNSMGLKNFRISFNGDYGVLNYTNANGDMELAFGLGKNEFSKFPEKGYSDLVATFGVPGHQYDCAASAEWIEPQKLHIKVQVIDKYFGTLDMVFAFKDSRVTVVMEKTAEAFLTNYEGIASGKQA